MSEQTENKKKKNHLPLIIGLSAAAVCILILIGIGISAISRFQQNFGLPVEVEHPMINDIVADIKTTGTISSTDVTSYTTSIAATVEDIQIKPGQSIQAGDTILTFDIRDLEDQYDQAALNARSTELSNQSTIDASNESSSELTKAKQAADNLRSQIETVKQEIADLQTGMEETGSNDLTLAIMEQRNQLTLVLENIQTLLDSNPESNDINTNPDYIEACAKRDALTSSISNLEAILSSSADMSDSITAVISAKSSELADLQGQLATQEALIESAEAGILTDAQREQLSIASKLSTLQVDAAAASLEEGKAGIIAKQDGIVTSVDITEGQTATPGYPLFTIASTDQLKVTIALTKKELETVALGQSATVTLLNRDYEGTVTYISHMANTSATGTTTIDAEITLQHPDDSIILGMDAQVVIHTASKKDVLTIPNIALNVDNTGTFVYTVEDNVVVKKYITTGISDDTKYEVLDGITKDTLVITNITSAIQEGLPVIPNDLEEQQTSDTSEADTTKN